MKSDNTIRNLPLAQLVASERNARTIHSEASIGELAASILAEGLLQNLNVETNADGTFGVVAGERRRRALILLRDAGTLPPDLLNPPCRIVENGRALSASLSENSVRVKMHPADEFAAFGRLLDQGKTVEDIAQEFGIVPRQVERQLRLARVAPALFAKFRADEITLEQMQALAVTDDHKAQLAAWKVPDAWQREPHRIRERLTKTEIDIARDAAAKFVGARAILDAGGEIRADLFGAADSGFCRDRALIDSLALDKAEKLAEPIRAEGWAWVLVRVEKPADYYTAFSTQYPQENARPLSKGDKAELSTIEARMTEISDKVLEDGMPDPQFDDEFELLESKAEAIKARASVWTADQLAACGVLVTVGASGALLIERGLLRKGDKVGGSTNKGGGGTASGKSGKSDKVEKPDMSQSMTMRLTAHRTAVLQGALSAQPRLALVVLAHRLLSDLFFKSRFVESVCLIRLTTSPALEQLADELPLMRHWLDYQERCKAIEKGLPTAATLFEWLLEQSSTTIDELLAYCIAASINTLTPSEDNKTLRAHTHQVLDAAAIDMAAHWEPTREAFLDHVPRSIIEAAVLEVHDQAAVDKLAKHKKGDLVLAAEALLANRQWLPKILRRKPVKGSGQVEAVAAALANGTKKPAAAAKKAAPKKAAPSKAKAPAKPAKKAPVGKAKPANKAKAKPAKKKAK